MGPLHNVAVRRAELAAHLAAADTGTEDGSWIEALIDTLEGVEGELAERVEARLRVALSLEVDAEACAAEAKRLAARRVQLVAGAERIRETILAEMRTAGLSTLPLAIRTLAIVAGRERVEIETESEIPTQLMRVRREPDKRAIGDSLRAGDAVPGARLARGPDTLRVSS